MENPNPQFATTQWTMVWKAAEEDSQHGRPALAEVIRRYWMPLYTYARRQGLSSEDAEDATQEFLSSIISGNLLESADPAKGKFRAFLLTAWKRFLVDEYRKKNAARRGGKVQTVSLDVSYGEQNWRQMSLQQSNPDHVFALSWASSLLEQARQRLRQEYQSKGKSDLIEALLPWLTETMDATCCAQLADQLGLSRGAVKVAIHRLRQRFGAAVRELVVETVEDTADIDSEINELLEALARQ